MDVFGNSSYIITICSNISTILSYFSNNSIYINIWNFGIVSYIFDEKMDWLTILSAILNSVFATGFIVAIATLRSERRKRKAEAGISETDYKKAEIDVAEKEAAVNASRAERAWKRSDKLEDKIDELIKEIDEIQNELIKVKIELAKEKEEKLEIMTKYNMLRKKILLECKCLDISWDEFGIVKNYNTKI